MRQRSCAIYMIYIISYGSIAAAFRKLTLNLRVFRVVEGATKTIEIMRRIEGGHSAMNARASAFSASTLQTAAPNILFILRSVRPCHALNVESYDPQIWRHI
ncbi:hypothetical protein MPC1_6280002 [Methylocella tundrae]|nr:hypothetical protein MPC1_6280002 [Methylocella tundrae]